MNCYRLRLCIHRELGGPIRDSERVTAYSEVWGGEHTLETGWRTWGSLKQRIWAVLTGGWENRVHGAAK